MKIQIWHIMRDGKPGILMPWEATAANVADIFLGNNETYKYRHVANVEVPDAGSIERKLEFCFERSNTISSPWFENEDVEMQAEFSLGCRSTSVGDLAAVPNDAGGFDYWACMNMGWQKLTGLDSTVRN